jgi:solute carrier family 25 thiamine pyrophosphate transporter 19
MADNQQPQQQRRQRHSSASSAASTGGVILEAMRRNKDVLAGCASGAASRVVTAPLDVAKIRFQLDHGAKHRYVGLWSAMKSIYAEEGMVSLWRGNAAAMYLWVSYSGIQFSVYGSLTRHLDDMPSYVPPAWQAASKPVGKFCAGASASAVATIATYPLDIMRTTFAAQGVPRQFHSSIDFVTSSVRLHGLRCLYRGIGPALVQIVPQMGLCFTLYETIKDWQPFPVDSMRAVAWPAFAGASAGLLSKLVVYPFDTLKKRMQAAAILEDMVPSMQQGLLAAQRGPLRAAVYLWKSEGTASLYRGIRPAIIKSALATAVSFWSFEWVKRALDTAAA